MSETSSDEDKPRRRGKTGAGRGKVMSDGCSSPDLGSEYEESGSESDTRYGGKPTGRGVGHKKIFDSDSEEECTQKRAKKGRARTKAQIQSSDEDESESDAKKTRTVMKDLLSDEDDEFAGLEDSKNDNGEDSKVLPASEPTNAKSTPPVSPKSNSVSPPESPKEKSSPPLSPQKVEENGIGEADKSIPDTNGKVNGHPHSIDALLKSTTNNSNSNVVDEQLNELEKGADLIEFVTNS